MPDEKRTKIGATGPVRPVTAAVAAARVTPSTGMATGGTPAPLSPTPAPGHAGQGATSYLPPQTDPLLGQVLNQRYIVHKKLGEGGMGAVYLATHNVLERQFAVKVLHGEFARKPDLVERFMGEAKAASRIRHENVIDISDFGTTAEGLVYFAMELLSGHDLHEEVARARLAGQLLPWERSKKIFLQICSALTAAHALGIVHRDLKPENIYLIDFLGEPDFVKLLDFGIAKFTEVAEGDRKLTKTGMLFGTPEYMSPEQARGESVDHRVDIYAMGCILFQLVTGRVPFEAENFMGVLSLHLTEPPPVIPAEVLDSIGAPRALAAVIDRALAKDRNQRYATIDELARAVRRASGDKATGPVTAQASVPAPAAAQQIGRVKTQWTGTLSVPESEPAPPPPRSRWPLVVGAVLLVGGGAGAAAFVATRGGGSGGTTPGSAGSAGSAVAAQVAPTPPPGPGSATPAPPGPGSAAPPPAFAFPAALIMLTSEPPGAEVKLVPGDVAIGKTPLSHSMPPSRTPITFVLHRAGYGDAVVQLVPDRERINESRKLVRVVAELPGHARPVDPRQPPTGTPPGVPTTRPDPGPGSATPAVPTTRPDPGPGSAARPPTPPAPPPDDDIMPHLKSDPSRAGSGAAPAATPPAAGAP